MYLQGVRSVYDLEWGARRHLRRPLPAQRGAVEPLQLRGRRHRGALRAASPSTSASAGAAWRQGLVLPAYDQVLKCSHAFNLLDARGVISVTERGAYIWRVRALAARCARAYLADWIAAAPRRPARCLTCSSRSAARSCPPAPAARSWSRRPGSSPRRWPALGLDGRRPVAGVGGAAPLRGPRAGPARRSWRPRPGGARPAGGRGLRPDGAPTKAAEGFARGQGVAVGGPGGARGPAAATSCSRSSRGEGRAGGRRWCPTSPRALVDGPALLQDHALGRRHRACASRGRCAGSWPSSTTAPCPSSCTASTAGDVSQGHRFLGGPATIASAGGYATALRGRGRGRRATRSGGRRSSPASTRPPRRPGGAWRDPRRQARGGRCSSSSGPACITGRIDERHMRLPPRVLVTAMQGHQRYFPLEDARRAACCRPSSRSPTATRPTRTSSPAATRTCSTRACRTPRSASTRTWRPASPPSTRRLDAIVFHKRLGTMADKRDRLRGGRRRPRRAASGPTRRRRDAGRARARWPRPTRAPCWWPSSRDLQGYVAAEYARREGIDAGRGHGRSRSSTCPRAPTRPLPATEAGALLAAAEKVDNLVGAFAVDEAPTGSKDPYGLRRAAARAGADRPRPGLGPRPPTRSLDAAYARLTDAGRRPRGAPTATTVARDRRLPRRTASSTCSAREGVGAEAAAAAHRRRRSAASRPRRRWARAIEAARGGAPLPGRLDGGDPPHAHLARKGPGDDVTPAPPGRRRRRGRALRDAVARGARRRSRRPARARRLRRPALAAAEAAGRRRWTASSWTCSSTPTIPGCGPGGTGWCGRRPGSSRGSPTSIG